MSQNVLLFVYGSLRPGSGHAMSEWLQGQARHLGPAWLPDAELHRVSWYPGMVAGTGEVRGDLFLLADPTAALPALDAFEAIQGRDDDEYERRLCTVRCEHGEVVTAWAYWYRRPVQARVASGDWLRP